MSTSVRRLHLDADRLRAYSRRGNFHADPEEARRLGLPGLVAQGMQVGAPAYGILLDAWGEDFLAHGALEWKFVGMVLEEEVVAAHVDVDADLGADITDDDPGHGPTASITVVSESTSRTVLVGTARQVAPSRL